MMRNAGVLAGYHFQNRPDSVEAEYGGMLRLWSQPAHSPFDDCGPEHGQFNQTLTEDAFR